MDVLYFAWVRERIGVPKEQVETDAATVADLVAELSAREDRYQAAFADLTALRGELDRVIGYCRHGTVADCTIIETLAPRALTAT